VLFEGGDAQRFDAVVLATGYRPRVHALLRGAQAAFDDEGTPVSSGTLTALPGLYFCGFHVSPLSPRGMLCEMAYEAQYISVAIAAR